MKRRTPLLVGLAVLALGAATLPVAGQPRADRASLRASFEGEWRYDGTNAEGRRIIAGAIDRVVDDMFFLARGIARGRLEDANRFSPTIVLAFPRGRIAVTYERRFTYDVPADGTWRTVRDPEGDRVSCSHRFVGERIVERFRTDEGERTNSFTLIGDGDRMRYGVTVDGDSLPDPVRYRLDYRPSPAR